MARACETRALLLLLLCEGVMRCGQCSSPPHFLGVPRECTPSHQPWNTTLGLGGHLPMQSPEPCWPLPSASS